MSRPTVSALACAFVLVLGSVAGARAAESSWIETTSVTTVTLSSEPGDYIGQGQELRFSSTSADIFLGYGWPANAINVTVTTSEHNFILRFAAADFGLTEVGRYDDARRGGVYGWLSGVPGIDVFGGGRGCNDTYGWFQVDELVRGEGSAITALDLSFEQRCESPASPALTGTVRTQQVETLHVTGAETLTADFVGNVMLEADNATLDCDGHEVIGPYAPYASGGIQIIGALTGVTVRDCIVRDFEVNGIYADGPVNLRLQSNTVLGNSANGIHANGIVGGMAINNVVRQNTGSGLVYTASQAVVIRDTLAEQNGIGIAVSMGSSGITVDRNVTTGNWAGIVLEEADASTVTGNTIRRNGAEGIILSAAGGNTVAGNVANENGDLKQHFYAGIAVLNGSTGNTIEGNTTNRNGDVGIVLEASDDNVVRGNTANSNGVTGIESRWSSGYEMRGNTASLNGSDGFRLEGGSGNTVAENRSTGNGLHGIELIGWTEGEVRANVSTGNGQPGGDGSGIDVAGGSDGNLVVANTTDKNQDGIRIIASAYNVVEKNTANQTLSFGIPVFDGSHDNQIVGNTANGNQGYGIAAFWGAYDNTFRQNVARNTVDGFDGWDEEGLNVWIRNKFGTTSGI